MVVFRRSPRGAPHFGRADVDELLSGATQLDPTASNLI